MKIKNVLTALGKAACYMLLFVGMQTVAALLVLIPQGVKLAAEDIANGSAPNIARYVDSMSEYIMAQAITVALVSDAATLLALWLVFAIGKKRYFREISLGRPELRRAPSLIIGAAALALACGAAITLLPLPESLFNDYITSSDALGRTGFLAVMATVLIAPITEEVIFRGLVYTRLRRAMPVWMAALIASAAFALLHGQIVWIVYAFVMGLVLTLVFERTGSLYTSIAFHIAFNLAGGYLLMYAPANGFILVLAIAAAAACGVWFMRVSPPANNKILPEDDNGQI